MTVAAIVTKMIISHHKKFIYFATPKTGTSTIAKWLDANYRINVWSYEWLPYLDGYEDYDWLINKKAEGETWPYLGKHLVHLPKIFEDYFIFASVRNPYPMSVSWHGHVVRDFNKYQGRLEDFLVDELHFKPSMEFLNLTGGYDPPPGCIPIRVDKFVHLENLKEDLESLPFVDQPFKFKHWNKGCNLAFHNNKTVEFVRERCRADFERLGYSNECTQELISAEECENGEDKGQSVSGQQERC